MSQATNIKINIGDQFGKKKRKPRARKPQEKEKEGMSSFSTGGPNISIAVPTYTNPLRPFGYTPPVFAREPVAKAVASTSTPSETIPVPVAPPAVSSIGGATPREISGLTSYRTPIDKTPFSGAVGAGFIPSEAPILVESESEGMKMRLKMADEALKEIYILNKEIREARKVLPFEDRYGRRTPDKELLQEMRRYESAGSETSRASAKVVYFGDMLAERSGFIPSKASQKSGGSVQDAIASSRAFAVAEPESEPQSQPTTGGGGRVYKTTAEQRAKARARYAKNRDKNKAMQAQFDEINLGLEKMASGYDSNQ